MWTLPNIITLVRICFTPVIALLPFIEGYWPKLIAFIIFIIAAVSDIYIRDFDAKLILTFSRIWPAGGEPFG